MSKIIVEGREPHEIKAAEAKRKKEEAEKKKKIVPPTQKKFYDVKVDAIVPCQLTYRVFALDENDALEQIKRKEPSGVKPKIIGRKMIKAAVYEIGSSIIRLVKNF